MEVEHVSAPVARAINGLRAGEGTHSPLDLPTFRPRTLPELQTVFEREEAREYEDEVVPLRNLALRDDGLLEIPKKGAFAFTDWSRRQCASLAGLRWDRWFQNSSSVDQAEEMNRRFARAEGEVRLRTRMLQADEVQGAPGARGVLRAFVSPGYSPVKDSTIARLLTTVLAPVDLELKLVRFDITDRTTSYVVGVGKPYRVGGSGEVGDIWGGLLIRNSGVGFASLFAVAHLTRLLCKNGMTAPMPDAVLLRRAHRKLDDTRIRDLLAERVEKLPGRLREGAERLREAAGRAVANVEDAVRRFLDRSELPRRLLRPILDAYRAEPQPTEFGVSQAVTRAAQNLSPEERLELETAAGRYLVNPDA